MPPRMRSSKVVHVGTNSLIHAPARVAVSEAVKQAYEAGQITSTDPNLRLHLWKDRYSVWCMESPAAVMRAAANGTPFDGRWREDLRTFVEHQLAGEDATDVLARGCVRCADVAEGWDFDCVAACRKHAADVAKGGEKTRKKWHDQIEGQGVMV